MTDLVGEQPLTLVECAVCGAKFQRSILGPAWMARLYGEWIDERQIKQAEDERDKFADARQAVKHLLRLHQLVHPAPGGEGCRLLDYGCGGGGFVRLARLFGVDAYGVDLSGTRERMAASLGASIVRSIEELDASAAGSFHAVTMFQVLEHLPAPREVLEAIAARMAPGGILIAEVPDCTRVPAPPTDVEEFMLVHPLEHINVFTPVTLQALCERAGFERIPRRPAHVTTYWRELVKTEFSRFVTIPTTQQYFRRLQTTASTAERSVNQRVA